MAKARFHLLGRLSLALIATAPVLLAACSSDAPGDADERPDPVAVQTARPMRETFHATVAAFGQLAADTRNALALSLPQAGRIVATAVVAGQRVARGDPLLKLETDPATRNAYLQARSALKVAEDNLVRTQHMHAEKLATNAELDAARKSLADARTALAAQARLGGASTTTTLRAPADGVVTTLDVRRGQRVAAGTLLIQFAPAASLDAQLGVDPGAAADIRPGMPVVLRPVYAARGADPLRGTVAMVGDAVDPQSHLVDIVATLDTPVALPAGTALSGVIETTPLTAWAVPRNALQSDARGSYVFQLEHGKAQRVDVKVLAPGGNPVGVAGKIDPHAPVITLGSYELSDGDAVKAASQGTSGS